MKKLFFLVSLLTFNSFGQINGLKEYKYSEEWRTIPFGERSFYYPEHSPYHKVFGYIEPGYIWGFNNVTNEAKRILKANGADFNKNYSVQSIYREELESLPISELYKQIRLGKHENCYVVWKISDINKTVSTYWFVELYIDQESVHVYVYNSYVNEIYDQADYIRSLEKN